MNPISWVQWAVLFDQRISKIERGPHSSLFFISFSVQTIMCSGHAAATPRLRRSTKMHIFYNASFRRMGWQGGPLSQSKKRKELENPIQMMNGPCYWYRRSLS
ncbi:hypothetical protein ACH5RR_012369 [Cinchona calisaya]|uniref:Ycf15 n=1 Tax=Cinchona calisaya TaxID=153742 RepID=A0ABD3A835_9GENT